MTLAAFQSSSAASPVRARFTLSPPLAQGAVALALAAGAAGGLLATDGGHRRARHRQRRG